MREFDRNMRKSDCAHVATKLSHIVHSTHAQSADWKQLFNAKTSGLETRRPGGSDRRRRPHENSRRHGLTTATGRQIANANSASFQNAATSRQLRRLRPHSHPSRANHRMPSNTAMKSRSIIIPKLPTKTTTTSPARSIPSPSRSQNRQARPRMETPWKLRSMARTPLSSSTASKSRLHRRPPVPEKKFDSSPSTARVPDEGCWPPESQRQRHRHVQRSRS